MFSTPLIVLEDVYGHSQTAFQTPNKETPNTIDSNLKLLTDVYVYPQERPVVKINETKDHCSGYFI